MTSLLNFYPLINKLILISNCYSFPWIYQKFIEFMCIRLIDDGSESFLEPILNYVSPFCTDNKNWSVKIKKQLNKGCT